MPFTSDEFTVFAFFEPGSKFIDCYRIVLTTDRSDETWAVTTGETGNHPQGVCLSTEQNSTEPVRDECEVGFDALPVPVQKVVENEKALHRHARAEYEKFANRP